MRAIGGIKAMIVEMSGKKSGRRVETQIVTCPISSRRPGT